VEFGFEGKTLIHPRQIAPCNTLFAPSATDIEWARLVKSAFGQAANARKGALSLDGVMVERLHLAQAERILDIQTAIRAARDANPQGE
jgi:citrate lyase subunit beta/citryl-CoA lyase